MQCHVSGLSPPRLRFDPGSVRVIFMVVFIRVLRFGAVGVIPSVLHSDLPVGRRDRKGLAHVWKHRVADILKSCRCSSGSSQHFASHLPCKVSGRLIRSYETQNSALALRLDVSSPPPVQRRSHHILTHYVNMEIKLPVC